MATVKARNEPILLVTVAPSAELLIQLYET